jgi:hypothetical protein
MRKSIPFIASLVFLLTSCSSGGPTLSLPTDWEWAPVGYKGESKDTKVSDFNVAFKNTSEGMDTSSDTSSVIFYTFISKEGCSDYLEVDVNFTPSVYSHDVRKTVTQRVEALPAMSYKQFKFLDEGVVTVGGAYVYRIVCKQIEN